MAITENAARRPARPETVDASLGLIGFVLGLIIVVVGNYHVSAGENGGTGAAIFSAIVCLVVAVGLFGFVVPRAQNIERTTLILGVVAVVSLAVFWLGITPILGAAAVAVSRRFTGQSTKVRVAQILGVAAGLLAFVVTLAQNA